MTNIETKARQFNIGTVNRIDARQRVPIQLKVLIAEGTAINMVVIIKAAPNLGFIPLWNMWCPHTIQLRKAIAIIAKTIDL